MVSIAHPTKELLTIYGVTVRPNLQSSPRWETCAGYQSKHHQPLLNEEMKALVITKTRT